MYNQCLWLTYYNYRYCIDRTDDTGTYSDDEIRATHNAIDDQVSYVIEKLTKYSTALFTREIY